MPSVHRDKVALPQAVFIGTRVARVRAVLGQPVEVVVVYRVHRSKMPVDNKPAKAALSRMKATE